MRLALFAIIFCAYAAALPTNNGDECKPVTVQPNFNLTKAPSLRLCFAGVPRTCIVLIALPYGSL